LILASAVLLAACLLAGLFPARTAARADPRAALQAE
jgi:ABC-type antimicrobial peptide transport system permease subunit